MVRLSDIVKAFLHGIGSSRISLTGAILTTFVFPFLLGSIILDLLGYIDNPYYGFTIYMVLGPLFILGLILIFLGLFFFKGQAAVQIFTMEYLREQFSDPVRFIRVRRLIALGVVLTVVNVAVVLMLAYSGYHYMESVAFCGRFCHSVMDPEYTAYRKSPHSNVPCVECHIGSGAQWFVKSKLSGSRQLYAVLFGTYSRPIATPVHGLRPARETCEECHRPELFHGDKLVVRDRTLTDENNTSAQTVLLMKIGSAGDRTVSSHGIHWHIAPENRITYSADRTRTAISEVVLTRPDGSKKVYRAAANGKEQEQEQRVMDCVDCHNRPTHIYLSLDDALDRKFQEGAIPRTLPFIKREATTLLKQDYTSTEAARRAIETGLTDWYRKNYAELLNRQPGLLPQAIAGVQAAYAENVYPSMKIQWDTYRSLLGHGSDFDSGCFRCHDGNHKTESGEEISSDCNTCHTVLAEGEKDPAILKTLRGE